MTLHQAMTLALGKMKMGGLQFPFGAAPTNAAEIKMQSDAYLVALNSATKRQITAEGLNLTAEMFLSGRVKSADPAKFPSAPEFARAFSDAMDSQFMCLGVPVDMNTVKLIEVRRDTPAAEVRKIIEANTPKVIEMRSDLSPEDIEKLKTGFNAQNVGDAGSLVVRKFTGAGQTDAFEPTDEETEIERQRQIDELREAETRRKPFE
jgi:hypothetical protein